VPEGEVNPGVLNGSYLEKPTFMCNLAIPGVCPRRTFILKIGIAFYKPFYLRKILRVQLNY
jgi:hypothetical protein